MAAAKSDVYDYGDNHNYEGKWNGTMYDRVQAKPKEISRHYFDSLASCCWASTVAESDAYDYGDDHFYEGK